MSDLFACQGAPGAGWSQPEALQRALAEWVASVVQEVAA